MHRNFILRSFLIIVLTLSVTACGKRGDPYRPSEIPAKSNTQTPAS